MQYFSVILVFLMFAWAFFTVVQAKMNQAVKQIYREFHDKGEIYFGRTSGYRLTLPHVVVIVCCDVKGVILDCRCVTIRTIRGQPDIRNWSDVKGKEIRTLNSPDYSNEKHLQAALDDLLGNYQKFHTKAKKSA